MKIMVIGDVSDLHECESKFGPDHEYFPAFMLGAEKRFDVIFDFRRQESGDFSHASFSSEVVFINVAVSGEIGPVNKSEERNIFGFAGMTTFLDREIFEVSLFDDNQRQKLEETCAALGTAFTIVKNGVGLFTPRVVCMIINEAYFAVMDGTANKDDIDVAMKLGTNYPYGPFEWCDRIGIAQVYQLLLNLYRSTSDERYEICPLLKTEYESA